MDCNKTINFLHELQRLCDSRTACAADAANEEQCPMLGRCEDALTKIDIEDAKKLIENLQKWSDEHPKKTYVQDFFEKFPKAQSSIDGAPLLCRQRVYGETRPAFEDCNYPGTCKNCWDEPMEE